ncbi:hypothetical protein GCM10010124_19710 [Pilimelia terevasa]|uniref:DUF6879 domain-containing protein n=1 Tax=Pilimelia terevasa TaxID=53372 RepID=A0A8J3FH23_9ACTN|nr:hypothetical protein GCM10010124_19710 [Pilimelia terevasa]
MHEVSREEFFDHCGRITRSWVHLEQQHYYGVPSDVEPFQRWQRGEPDDLSYMNEWCEFTARLAADGRTLRRLRLISPPVLDYHRWVASVAFRIVEAGESLRWCDRRDVPEILVPVTDYYVLDEKLALFLHFSAAGEITRRLMTDDPAVVSGCLAAFENCWGAGTDHGDHQLD